MYITKKSLCTSVIVYNFILRDILILKVPLCLPSLAHLGLDLSNAMVVPSVPPMFGKVLYEIVTVELSSQRLEFKHESKL